MVHTVYDNFVLENKIEDMLTTHLDASNYLTVDYSLAENPGNIKKIHKYTAIGDVEDLAMGDGNTDSLEVVYDEAKYEVKTTQGKLNYYDEQESADPMLVEVGLKGLADKMANDMAAKAIAELEKGNLVSSTTTWDFDAFADAIALYPYEEEEGLFILINPAQKAAIRKALGDDLKYSEGFARTGYIGSVCGVPVMVSKAVPAGEAFLATKQAVTAFVKKGVEIEQDRNIDTRENTIVARKVAVVALTDATRVIKIGSAISNLAAAYSAANHTFSGACTENGAVVTLYGPNGDILGTATVATNTYSITYNAPAGKYTLVARKEGKVARSATVTVA